MQSRQPFIVWFLCTARQVMGPNFQPLESITNNAELARAVQRRREQSFEVTLVAGSITADMSYAVNWPRSSKMDVDANLIADLLRSLPSLGS